MSLIWEHRARALLIGMNYAGTKYKLNGCIADVNRVKNLLSDVYKINNAIIMTDERSKTSRLYTSRQNILGAIRTLSESLQNDGSGVVHISGHGVIINGKTYIIPSDALTENGRNEDRYISNDDLMTMLSVLKPGATLFFVVDACNSERILPLEYTLKLNSSEASECSLERIKTGEAMQPSIVLLTACQSNELAKDLPIDGYSTGILTYAYCETLRQVPNITHVALIKSVRSFIESNTRDGRKQTPQLSFSYMTDCAKKFSITGSKSENTLEREIVECYEDHCLD